MRIGLIAHHVAPVRPPFGGGVESFTWYLARWLADRGHDVVLYAPVGSRVRGVELRPLDLEVTFSDAARGDVSMPPDAFMAAHHAYTAVMLELADDPRPFDIVHSNTLHYLPLLMAPTLSVPMLTTLHTPPTPWLESAVRQVASRGVPSLSTVSKATSAAWEPIVRDVPVVRNGVDTGHWQLGPGGATAVWSGRIVPEKAPHVAIDASRRAGLPLRIAGPVLDRAYWSAEVAPRLGDDVRYVGHLAHDDLGRLLRSARVALVTPAWDEPFGLVAAEAMACGTPVAGFDRGGLRDIVGDAGGRLVGGRDVTALVAAIDAAAALDRGEVRRHAERTVGLDAMGRGYEQLYARLVDRSPVPLPVGAERSVHRRPKRAPAAAPLAVAS